MRLHTLTDQQFWDEQWSQRRDEQQRLSPNHLSFGKRGLFLRLLKARLGDLRGKRVLELGGGGVNRRLLAMRKWAGVRVTAVDFSEVALDQLRQLFHAHDEPLDVVHANVFDWQPDQRFEFVVHWGVVEHFVDPGPILQVSRRCLLPHGRLLFSMPNLQAWSTAFWRRWSPDNWAKHVFHDKETIWTSCERAKLRLDDAFYFGVPALQVPTWEQQGCMPATVTWLQRVAKASAALMPCYHAIGGKRWSMHRGFVATNVAVP